CRFCFRPPITEGPRALISPCSSVICGAPVGASRGALVWAVRALWTLPTNVLGHLAGLLSSGGRLPRRVGGPAAVGWLYPIRSGLGLDWVAAVTIGHAI